MSRLLFTIPVTSTHRFTLYCQATSYDTPEDHKPPWPLPTSSSTPTTPVPVRCATNPPKPFPTLLTHPGAHRAHIALAELNLPYEEEIIDLSVPRTEAYLAINPRGLVPSLSYNGEIITESGVVAQFLADAHPSHLVPVPKDAPSALRRARISFFVDTFVSKLIPLNTEISLASATELPGLVSKFTETVAKELEPLLQDASPFFGGSEKLTLAEVQTGSFAIRLLTLPALGVYPEAITAELPQRAPAFWKWAQATAAHPSVKDRYDAEKMAPRLKEILAKRRAEKEAQK